MGASCVAGRTFFVNKSEGSESMRKTYVSAEIEILRLSATDVIRTSGDDDGDNAWGEWDE